MHIKIILISATYCQRVILHSHSAHMLLCRFMYHNFTANSVFASNAFSVQSAFYADDI